MLRRKLLTMRRLLHVKGDVLCTLVLLGLLGLLLYARQVLLSPGWSRPAWRLEIHGSTSSSRTLLGAGGARGGQEPQQLPAEPQLPPCEPRSKSKPPLPKSKTKSKSRRRGVAPTRPAARAPPTMPAFDFQAYLRDKDNRNFRLLIDQPEKCRGPPPYMLIAVKSTAADFHRRQVVRRTWGREGRVQPGGSIRTVFLLGVPRNGSALPLWDRLLAYESQSFGDILLWDFQDTFFNLTLKETHFLEWVNSSCPHVSFIFKGDADVYVNVENLLELLRGRRPDQDLFVGDIILHAKPIRRRSSKYYVPESLYGAARYPTYAGGGGFLMSGLTARRLSAACQQVELFPIDDVFLGMCLQLIGVRPLRHLGFRTFGIVRPSAAPHLQTFDPCFYRELMVVHSLTVPQIWLMWNLLHDPQLSCHNSSGPASSRPFRWRGTGPGQDPDPGQDGTDPGQDPDYGERQVFVSHQ
ncbi:unnamed protein product [Menidia menidia]|uniref:Hexosyltransferase n=1 Tax=Menidia menidia TaxID=238744 RepID=A0A8S4BI56_9TELE|nr:unnamed protein product [Menidia menidia]